MMLCFCFGVFRRRVASESTDRRSEEKASSYVGPVDPSNSNDRDSETNNYQETKDAESSSPIPVGVSSSEISDETSEQLCVLIAITMLVYISTISIYLALC